MARQKAKTKDTKDNKGNRVTFDLRPGLVSERQKKLWRLFWQKSLWQVKGNECENQP